MKKNLIYLLLFACSTTYAQQSNESNKEELNNILMALGEKPMNVSVKESNIVDNKANVVETKKTENTTKPKVEVDKVKANPAEELNNMVAELEPTKTVLKIDESLLSNTDKKSIASNADKKILSIEESLNTNIVSNESKYDIDSIDDIKTNDHVYLLNIPKNTQIVNNDDIYIYPYRSAIIFDDGKIVSSVPLKFTDTTTFCYFNVEESGDIRRLRSSNDNPDEHAITVVGNNSKHEDDVYLSEDSDKPLNIYTTELMLDHKHIKNIKCISTESNDYLTIEDFNRETGNRFNFNFPPVVDI